jgi:hypothetical protein
MALVEKASEITKIKQEVRSLKEELKSIRVDTIREEISQKGIPLMTYAIDDSIFVLREKLDEAYKDIELLSLDWDNIDSMLQTYVCARLLINIEKRIEYRQCKIKLCQGSETD